METNLIKRTTVAIYLLQISNFRQLTNFSGQLTFGIFEAGLVDGGARTSRMGTTGAGCTFTGCGSSLPADVCGGLEI